MKPFLPAQAYRLLSQRWGPQGWWPVTPPREFRPRYHPKKYSLPTDREALEIAVGAILTQNTSWSNVEKALESIHRAKSMSLDGLLNLSRSRMEKLIRSTGYFRQKAKRLRAFLLHVQARKGMTRWLSRGLAGLREEFLSIPGIGPETADSILLYAGARPVLVIDAYTIRIGARLGWFGDVGYDEAQQYLSKRLPRSILVYQEFHALMVVMAKLYCRKQKPLCGGCPLSSRCKFGRIQIQSNK